MAYEQINLARFGQFGVKARIQRFRTVLDQRAARKAVYNRTMRELYACSDRDLADLGFHRAEIPHIAQQAADLI